MYKAQHGESIKEDEKELHTYYLVEVEGQVHW